MHVLESTGTDPMGPYAYKARLHDSIDGWAINHSVLQLNRSLYLLFSAWHGQTFIIYSASACWGHIFSIMGKDAVFTCCSLAYVGIL
jgi:hypothetical protein